MVPFPEAPRLLPPPPSLPPPVLTVLGLGSAPPGFFLTPQLDATVMGMPRASDPPSACHCKIIKVLLKKDREVAEKLYEFFALVFPVECGRHRAGIPTRTCFFRKGI